MAFTLEEAVPWGRTYEEYVAMFSLTPKEIGKKILGCGDGPAAFNSTLTRQGGSIISADPLYSFSPSQIKQRINETYEVVLEQRRKNKDEFIWESISSVEELGRIRMSAMNDFLQDFDKGKKEGRYQAASLPLLPFKDKEFDMALCSHFLFLYSEQFSVEFHLRSIKELCRVARKVKIFPLLELGARKSRHLTEIITKLKKEKYLAQVTTVPYEFQKGGNEMLEISGH